VYAVRQTGRIRAWWKAIPLRRMCAPPPDRRRVILRGHPDIQAQRDRIGNPERATVSRATASTRLLHACQYAAGRCCRAAAAPRPSRQRRRRTIGCIGRLDFHGPLAAAAEDAQHVTLNFRKTSSPLLGCGRGGARVFEYRYPVFRREGRIRSRRGWARPPSGCCRQFFHLLRGRHAPTRRVDRSFLIRT
jgi:hypothetical protein